MNMLPINYLSGALVQSAQVQRDEAAEKAKQARKQRELSKNIAARDDEIEHQVENSEELTPIHEDNRRGDQKRKRNPNHQEEEEQPGEESGGLDLRA